MRTLLTHRRHRLLAGHRAKARARVSQRQERGNIYELKDIVAKKLTDDKPDHLRLGFCDFLKVEVVELTSDSYDDLTPIPYVSHPDAGPTAADATDIYTSTTRTSTAAAFTAFTAALPTDIYSVTCTSSTADPGPGSTTKHAVTAAHARDVSTAAANATAATNTNTTANTAASNFPSSQQQHMQQGSQQTAQQQALQSATSPSSASCRHQPQTH